VTIFGKLCKGLLVGFLLLAWTESKRRKAISTGKFYFFDPGATHTLSGTEVLDHNSHLYGKAFEQFIGMEIRAYLSYKRKKVQLSYWRSVHGYEVDFLMGRQTEVEVKASQKISQRDFNGLRGLEEEKVFKNYILVSQDPINTRENHFQALFWEDFLKDLWEDKFLTKF
jgi:uncharacterized protein